MGAAGIAVPMLEEVSGNRGIADGTDAGDRDARSPHTEATFRALVDAIVPETPAFADDDPQNVPGGLDADVEEFVMWVLDNYVRIPPSADAPGTTVPLSAAVAATLDAAATQLLARGGAEDDVDPARFSGGGAFAGLSREDRVRALRDLESGGLDDELPDAFDRGGVSSAFLVSALHALVNAGHYTEWAGYGDTKTDSPTDWEFREPSLGWRQTGYPGAADGYAAHRGYAVRRFRENDYGDQTGGGDGSPGRSDGAEAGEES